MEIMKKNIVASFAFCILLIVSGIPLHAQSGKMNSSRTNADPQYPPVYYSGLHWRNIGPFRAGRSIAVTGIPGDKRTYYAGEVGGGLWKTTDAGMSWHCVSDSTFTSSSVGAVAVAPSNPNVVYVGMGEVEMRGNISFGDGVYKSLDAGKSWTHVGLKNSYAIGKIAVDPRDENVVYVAAQGHVWGPNPERGLYKSTDGGANWTRILKGPDDTTGCVDVKIDPTNPNIIYASLWKAFRTPYSLSSGGKGSGLYKSIDGGKTWALLSENPGMPKGLVGKIMVTISSQDHDKLWATVENKNPGIFYSSDGGDTWELLNTQNDLLQRPWYFSGIFVDPTNDNVLYVENVEFWKSIDGGKTFDRVETGGGWDLHTMWLNPEDGSNYITGTDGGPYITLDGGNTFSEANLPTAQFYHVNLDHDFPYHVYGAQQDNSSLQIKSRTSGGSIGENDYHPVAGGEAGYIVPDPLNSKITYGGEYDGIFSTYNEETELYRIISIDPEQHYGSGAITAKDRFNWTFPIAFSPNNPKCLYATSNYVHRSFDGGVTWEKISPDLTRHDPKTLQASGGPITLDNTGTEYYATIFAFAESPVKAGVLWSGSDDGLVYVSPDNGKTWNNVTPKSLPDWSMISYVEPSHFDAAICYISATRYKSDDMHPYVYKTNDYGKTWTKITDGLPDAMYNRCVREDPVMPGLLYCGLETGIYVSFDDGAHWQSLQLNLPVTPVADIQIQKTERDIVLATHGRSFWILDDITPLYEMKAHMDSIRNAGDYLFEVYDAWRTPGPGYNEDESDMQAGENEPEGVKVRYFLAHKPAGELRMIFYDAKGDSIITYSNLYDTKRKPVNTGSDKYYENTKETMPGTLDAQPGMHAFIWDMRYPDARGDTSATFDASLDGPLAVPGKYLVKLYAGDTLIGARTFTIRKDPRNPASLEELQAQFDLNKKICNTLDTIAKACDDIKMIRNNIQDYLDRQDDSSKARAFRMASKPVLDSLDAVDSALHAPKVLAYEDNLKFPIELEEKLAGLNWFLQMADAGPTASMSAKYDDLLRRINIQLDRLHRIEDADVPKLNALAGGQTRKLIELEE